MRDSARGSLCFSTALSAAASRSTGPDGTPAEARQAAEAQRAAPAAAAVFAHQSKTPPTSASPESCDTDRGGRQRIRRDTDCSKTSCIAYADAGHEGETRQAMLFVPHGPPG